MAEETNPLDELLQDELKDLYSAESQIIKALPRMAKGASSPELKRAFERHLEDTRRQVDRLNQIGEMLEMKQQTLNEEGATDKKLIALAESVVNYEAANA